MIRPVVKWAGGKTQLLDEIIKRLPQIYNRYFEPFVGGGALLFQLKPQDAVINDLNYELVCVYECLKDKELLKKLIEKLNEHEKNHSKAYFQKIRILDRTDQFKNLSKVDIAARMIYLNKSGYNGMYRVNSKGHFNVPMDNSKEKVKLYNFDNLMNIHKYFTNSNIVITNGDFEEVVKEAKIGDFVYFDPPYDTYENQKNFTSYSKQGFSKEDQKRLFEVFNRLSKTGVYVMLSNHNTDFIRELYKDYKIDVVLAKRMINSKATQRGPVEEVIIRNYE